MSLWISCLQAEVFAELGDVINGTKPALREKTTVFKSLGKTYLPISLVQIMWKILKFSIFVPWIQSYYDLFCFFTTTGMGVEDAVSAELVFQQWTAKVGQP